MTILIWVADVLKYMKTQNIYQNNKLQNFWSEKIGKLSDDFLRRVFYLTEIAQNWHRQLSKNILLQSRFWRFPEYIGLSNRNHQIFSVN